MIRMTMLYVIRKNIRSMFPLSSSKQGMTLMEVLIVISLISMISVAIYGALSNGINVWEKSNQLVVEEDVAIFFDKIAVDLHNAFLYSKIQFEGNEFRFSFPTVVYTQADSMSGISQDKYVYQIGEVEYYFNLLDKNIYRRQANYSQALSEQFGPPQLLVNSVERLNFRYFYITDEGELLTDSVFEVLPAGIEIEVEFMDSEQNKIMRKIIDVPVGI